MAFEDSSASSSLEQFTLLAKNARGRACVALIQQALSNKRLFVFRELLDMPNVQQLRGTEHEPHVRLLEIFCFGKYSDYLANKDALPPLTPAHELKLRKLTTVSLAQASKNVPYATLMKELDVPTIRELEDILIETIYSGLVQGKLDQKSQSLLVKFAVGRDTQNADIDLMIEKLTRWKAEATTICTKIDGILQNADSLAQSEKEREDAIRTKGMRVLSERGKPSGPANLTSSGSFRHEDFAFADVLGGGARRTGMPKRMNSTGSSLNRKGRI